MEEYIIINKTAIQKIDELIKEANSGKTISSVNSQMAESLIKFKEHLLSQSTPLIPEIEKAFNVGVNSQFEVQEKNLTNKEEIRDYHQKKLINISNLKLDL